MPESERSVMESPTADRPQWMVTARPMGLLGDLLIAGGLMLALVWNPALPWWSGVAGGVAGAAVFYALRRCARRLAEARSAAVLAGMYAAQAERRVVPGRLVFDPAAFKRNGQRT